jgi:uncharacterized protein (DUF4415 family)
MKRAPTDPDDLPWTPEMKRRLRPMDAETIEFVRRARGRPHSAHPKQAVSLRLDRDVIEHFKKGGRGWQSRINAALRAKARLGPRTK